MNKIIGVILVILSIWVVKLSMDVYTFKKQQDEQINTSLEQQNQRIGKLTDQLVVLQKQSNTPTTSNKQPTQQVVVADNSPADIPLYTTRDVIYDKLQIIQTLLQQQRFNLALEQIQLLKQKIVEQQPLAESLNLALLQALGKDQNAITLYLQQRNEHEQVLQQELRQIEQEMQPKSLDQEQQKWQRSTWWNVSKANRIPDMQNRTLYFRQMQLQLLIAQQALFAGQITFYQSQIRDVVEGLSVYPDKQARAIVARLQKLDLLPLSTPPKLSALALMQED